MNGFATIEVTRSLPHPPDRVFAHWISPETRLRWEAGPDTGMVYDAFDTRPGGVETVRVMHEGAEVGHMIQRIHAAGGNRLVASTEGHFGGQVTFLMQLVVAFEPEGDGTHLTAVCQVADLSGKDPTGQHTAGWAWILDRFEQDIAEHGLVQSTQEER